MIRRAVLLIVPAVLAVLAFVPRLGAQSPVATIFDTTVAPGTNFEKANFRLWLPEGAGPLRAVAVLVPGSNGDGRGEVSDAVWQAFATQQHVALVGCQITDKPHDQGFIEDYVNVSKGTGAAFLEGLNSLAKMSTHPEVATAPLLLWGMSAGGQFNYEFTAWKPERVAAFVANKGGIYYSALVPRAAREVPGILYIGGKDLAFRTNTIVGLFAVNRRAGALWSLSDEPGAAHIVGKSKDMTIAFFEDVMPLRLGEPGASLKAMDPKAGFIGDLTTHTFMPAAEAGALSAPTNWFPTARVAKAWQAMVADIAK